MAAEQGSARGQASLGILYEGGWGVTQDLVEAHKWLNLAAAGLSREDDLRDIVVEARDRVAQRMTPAQIAEAQRLAREWEPGGGGGSKEDFHGRND
jgi:hypothetical protein